MQNKKNSRYAWILFWGFATLGCMVFIFCMSHKTASESGEMSGFIVEWLLARGMGRNIADYMDFIVRKCAHMTEYFVLTVCTTFLLINVTEKSNAGIRGAAVLISAAYAISDEVHQLFVQGRSGQAKDVLIDVIGSGMAFLVISLFFRRKRY